jgi:uncharacterized oligopeptide transporter (OPT) family protein
MAIQHLTDEQIRTWTVEQKDRWWLANVFRGDMPQLTLRSALTGFVLGGLLSATNLYVGAKTGWTLGVGLTSVILAFAMFKAFSSLGRSPALRIVVSVLTVLLFTAVAFGVASKVSAGFKNPMPAWGWPAAAGIFLVGLAAGVFMGRKPIADMTILENNCMQSIATSAGYMTGPLTSGIAAWMWVENRTMPWWQMMGFMVVLSLLGVLVAFPMKRRFINDEQQPFPEGRACGVVLDTLYTSDASVGLFKAKALAIAAFSAAFIRFITAENLMRLLCEKVMRLKDSWHLSEHLDAWYYALAEKGKVWMPSLAGMDPRKLGLSPTVELAMVGAGVLMGIKAASSMLIGMLINFLIIIPIVVKAGELQPPAGKTVADITRVHAMNNWALWWGIAIMVTAAMVGLFAKPKVIISAFTGMFGKKKAKTADVLGHIELPLWISIVGIPVVGAVGVWMAHDWFGVRWDFGATAIPLIIVLTLIAANSTALTGITPVGSLSKIPQFLFGALDPKHPPTNLMTGVMCVEVSSNASNLLMDIKPGYMLGAKPRQQAIGHCIGIVAGTLAATPLFFALFIPSSWPVAAETGQATRTLQEAMTTNLDGTPLQFGFPSAVQWKGVSDLVTGIFNRDQGGSPIPVSAMWSMVVAAVVGLVMELVRTASKGKFPLSPLAIGLGVVVPPDSTIAMFAGALFFWFMHRRYSPRPQSTGNLLWIQTQEPICAGLIAGFALMGIADVLVKVFVFAS